jgi:hypothetical protein
MIRTLNLPGSLDDRNQWTIESENGVQLRNDVWQLALGMASSELFVPTSCISARSRFLCSTDQVLQRADRQKSRAVKMPFCSAIETTMVIASGQMEHSHLT